MTENTFDNQQDDSQKLLRFVNVNSDLKKRAVSQGNSFEDEITAIQRAESALDELSHNFDDWIEEEVEKLKTATAALTRSNVSDEDYENLYFASHDLKGQAATLGYPLAAEICASLCILLDNIQQKRRIPNILILQHVDSVRAIINESVKDTENGKAKKLISKLSLVTKDFILQETQRHKNNHAA